MRDRVGTDNQQNGGFSLNKKNGHHSTLIVQNCKPNKNNIGIEQPYLLNT